MLIILFHRIVLIRWTLFSLLFRCKAEHAFYAKFILSLFSFFILPLILTYVDEFSWILESSYVHTREACLDINIRCIRRTFSNMSFENATKTMASLKKIHINFAYYRAQCSQKAESWNKPMTTTRRKNIL